jgi:hypothetical protein
LTCSEICDKARKDFENRIFFIGSAFFFRSFSLTFLVKKEGLKVMRPEVLIDEAASRVKGKFLHRGSRKFARWIVASSLMSDVLTTDEEDILLLSNLNTAQVVRTADMIGAAAVMIACGKPVPQDTLDLARELDISLICTEFPIFETCIHLVPLFNTVKK